MPHKVTDQGIGLLFLLYFEYIIARAQNKSREGEIFEQINTYTGDRDMLIGIK